MATYFGEVIEPSSRAVYDDSDFNECDPEITWVPSNPSFDKIDAEIVILCHGRISKEFINGLLDVDDLHNLGHAQIKVQKQSESQRLDESGLKYDDSEIYQFNFYKKLYKTVEICFIMAPLNIPENGLYGIKNRIFESLEVSEKMTVVILTTEHVSNFKSKSDMQDKVPFLRQLTLNKADANNKNLSPPFLERPNIITGFPAAVLSHCGRSSIPAVLYVCYVDVLVADSINVQALSPILEKSPLNRIFKPQDLKMKHQMPMDKGCGNLYI